MLETHLPSLLKSWGQAGEGKMLAWPAETVACPCQCPPGIGLSLPAAVCTAIWLGSVLVTHTVGGQPGAPQKACWCTVGSAGECDLLSSLRQCH